MKEFTEVPLVTFLEVLIAVRPSVISVMGKINDPFDLAIENIEAWITTRDRGFDCVAYSETNEFDYTKKYYVRTAP
jgi:hypothetical protein